MNVLDVSGIHFQYADATVLSNIQFSTKGINRLAIAGATGSGKSTLLRLIGGLLQPASGTILFNGAKVLGPDEQLMPGHKGIVYHSQHFELRNHYRVHELLEMQTVLSDDETQKIYKICAVEHLLKRPSSGLSGGERQRVALAMALVSRPQLLLLDEPFSNLDLLHKNTLKEVIEAISSQLQVQTILVSHDASDVLPWAEMILILEKGKIIQRGQPHQVYHQPVSTYAGQLFGKYLPLHPAQQKALQPFYKAAKKHVPQFYRPEDFCLTDAVNGMEATVKKLRFQGAFYEAECTLAGQPLHIYISKTDAKKSGAVWIKPV